MPKIDYTWLIVGIIVGYVLHMAFSHPKSPMRNVTSFYGGNK